MVAVKFTGYAALFDVRDAGGDIIRRGAFGGARGPLPLLWQHDPQRPIGRIHTLREDGIGLFIEGEVDGRAGTGAAVADMVRGGAINGLSFGYRVQASRSGGPGHGGRATRELTAIDIIEVSIVTHPMQAGARVQAVLPPAS